MQLTILRKTIENDSIHSLSIALEVNEMVRITRCSIAKRRMQCNLNNARGSKPDSNLLS